MIPMLRTFANGTVLGIAFSSFIVFASQKRLFWKKEKRIQYTIPTGKRKSKFKEKKKCASGQ